MKRFLWTAVVAVLAVAAVPNVATAADAFKDVVVRNTTAEPVPTKPVGTTAVSGGVAITNTPTVNLGNTPTVNLGNTPTVTVEGPVAVTGHVSVDRGQPWQITDSLRTNEGSHHSALGSVFVVPTGKDLIVTFITMRARDFSGGAGAPRDANVTSAEGPGIQVFVPLERQGSASVWSASIETEVRFPRQLAVSVESTPSTGYLQYDYTISGYLVDEPAS